MLVFSATAIKFFKELRFFSKTRDSVEAEHQDVIVAERNFHRLPRRALASLQRLHETLARRGPPAHHHDSARELLFTVGAHEGLTRSSETGRNEVDQENNARFKGGLILLSNGRRHLSQTVAGFPSGR